MEDDVWRQYPLEGPFARAPGVPRRFGVGVLMILMTFFAVVFAVLASLGASPGGFLLVGVFLAGIMAGQVLLFDGKAPRRASVLVGMTLLPLEIFGLGLLAYLRGEIDVEELFKGFISGAICAAFTGGLVGLWAGAFIGAFLRWALRWCDRWAMPSVGLRPFVASDVDRLIGWIDSPQLLWHWAPGIFREPLDREQIERHHEPAGDPDPKLRAFTAFSLHSGDPVGYVELRDIDATMQSATVALALIGPDEPDRAALSLGLLRAVLRTAFGEMDLHRIQTMVMAYDDEPRGCYKAAGFVSEGILRESYFCGCRREDQRIMSHLRHEWLRDRRNRQSVGPSKPQPPETPEGET